MPSPFAPGLLVAPSDLIDPTFRRSVIVLAAHEPEGAMGYIITKQTKATFHELMGDLAIKPKIKDRRVLFGGPISKSSGFVAYKHPKNKPKAPGIAMSNTLSISPSREILADAAYGKIKSSFDLILGYVGWGPEQLEQEINGGGWLHAPFYQEILFEVPIEERWNYVFEKFGVSPLGFMVVPGGAQA